MKLEQRTITTIVADEGKLLKRKSDGWIAGERCTLGYNYYESGVGLSTPKLETPEDYEEIDKPEDYEQKSIIDNARRLANMCKIIDETTNEINTYGLPNNDALVVKNLYPEWSDKSISVKKGERYQYNDKLYEVVQDHVTQENWSPENQSSLWIEVVEGHEGTLEDPIPYNEELNPQWQGMILEKDKYYTQSGIIYKCVRDTEIKVTHNLIDLISSGFVEKI